tara:strand:- start:3171 stop:4022 length:852 start_codon:yes stop_codon:yes gene_type:complete
MRNNQRRLGGNKAPAPDAPAPVLAQAQQAPLAFVTPTEFVELPSRGRFYSADHPLHGEETVEIRYMTAKEEDILSSSTLIKKGIVIDRLLQSLLVDDTVDPSTLLVGDRNAILIAARISAYGSKYEAEVTCPSCSAKSKETYDMSSLELREKCFDESFLKENKVEFDNAGTFHMHLPRSDVRVSFGMLTGFDEARLAKDLLKKEDNMITGVLSYMVDSVDGNFDRHTVQQFVNSMPASDSRLLRKVYNQLIPNVDMTQEFYCFECAFEKDLEVPLNAEFFWPR